MPFPSNMGRPASVPDEAVADALIRAAVAQAGGWIPFVRFMELALYAPHVGYYSGDRRKFGAEGDFVTASGISSLFGATLARQVAQICEAAGPRVLEFGAGTGALAADILCAAGDAITDYAIIELSPALRARQRQTLALRAPRHAGCVRWLDTLPQNFSGCVLANEVLDAMPVHLVRWTGNEVHECGVVASSGTLALESRPALGAVAVAARAFAREHSIAAPYTSEINLAASAWTRSLADLLERGVLLLIDYGFAAREYYHPQRSSGTLMCHYRHRAIDDPLFRPGEADITAHVDFSAIAAAGVDAGLDLLGYVSQAGFLVNCGITDLIASTPASDAKAYLPLANQANRLLSPAEMGELFKVLALGRGVNVPLAGFSRGDRAHTL